MQKERNELSFDEMSRARHYFTKHVEECIKTPFQLRTILSEIGQYPREEELRYCLECFDGKLSFNNFCNYLVYLKRKFLRPEPKDVDTVRAFIALGGAQDRTGDISTEDLRDTCKHFELTIDIDKMLAEVDEDNSGTIDYHEFKSMWDVGTPDILAVEQEEGKMTSSLRQDAEYEMDEEDMQAVRDALFPHLVKHSTAAIKRKMSKKQSAQMMSRDRLPSLAAPLQDSMEPRTPRGHRESTAGPIKSGTLVNGVPVYSPTVLNFRHTGRKSLGASILNMKSPRPPSQPASARKSARGSPRKHRY